MLTFYQVSFIIPFAYVSFLTIKCRHDTPFFLVFHSLVYHLFILAMWGSVCTGFFSNCSEQELLCSFSARASVIVAPRLQITGSIVVGHRLRCSTAHVIFPDQVLNPRLLHRQMDSLPLSHQGSPLFFIFKEKASLFRNIHIPQAACNRSHTVRTAYMTPL